MSNYQLGIITGVIALLIWQYVIVRLIRRFVDMVTILMEGDSEAWQRLRGVINWVYIIAVITGLFLSAYWHFWLTEPLSLFFVIAYPSLVLTIFILGWYRAWIGLGIPNKRKTNREKVLAGIPRWQNEQQ